MKNKVESLVVLLIIVLAVYAGAAATARAASGAQAQHPMLDALANKIIQKYETSSCDQLMQQRIQNQGQPKSPAEQRAIAMLRGDAQARTAFIDKVAAPIANKLFDCGMIP